MCGITGWFSVAPIPPAHRARLGPMVDAIAHRGPDDRGELLEAHAALGHTRLAIIDLDHGRQPLTASAGDVSIVFNGEIYNYAELRRELSAAGCAFATGSDTEVIVNLYREHGAAAFSRLRGMYAFAIWDRRTATATLARDPIGVKPLFYRDTPGRELVFASEAKAIAARDGGAALDESALHLLMNFRYLPGERSLFRGIRQLRPGTTLTWTAEGAGRSAAIAPFPDAGAEPLAALVDAVRANLTADVEVAAYLSGGIDSAAIAAIAARHLPGRLRTFTLDVGDDPAEAENAARSAALLGVDNARGECPADLERTLPRLIWHLEVPKINAFQAAENARLAAASVKVALSGLGGDELFLGYNMHRIMHLAGTAHGWIPAAAGAGAGALLLGMLRRLGGAVHTERERAVRMLAELGHWPRVYGLVRNLWDSPGLRREVYGPRLLDAPLEDAFGLLEGLWPAHADPVCAAARFEWRHKLPNDFLWQEDRASMAHGLEVRVPFLDPVLAGAVQGLARRELMPRGRQKGYMRRMLRPLLPAEILARPKSGFQVDAPTFFHRHLRRAADIYLSRAKIEEHGLFNPGFAAAVTRLPPAKRYRWHYFMLYLMLGAHLWIELFERGTLDPGATLE